MNSTAAERLTQALIPLADRDGRTPCQGKERDRWTSDAPSDQALAITGCSSCPLIVECADAAREMKTTAGVWAGVAHDHKTHSSKRNAAA